MGRRRMGAKPFRQGRKLRLTGESVTGQGLDVMSGLNRLRTDQPVGCLQAGSETSGDGDEESWLF